jgi:hypothetical protein
MPDSTLAHWLDVSFFMFFTTCCLVFLNIHIYGLLEKCLGSLKIKINLLGALDQLSLTWLWLAYCCLYSCLTLIGNSLKGLLRSVLSLKPRISQKISLDLE